MANRQSTMDRLRRNYALVHRFREFTEPDRESADLIDLTQPFSWEQQSPQDFTHPHHRHETDAHVRNDVQRGFPDLPIQAAGFHAHLPYRPLTEGNASDDSAMFHPTQSLSRHAGCEHHLGQQSSSGYMDRDSPFSLDPSVKGEATEMSSSLLCWQTDAPATITYVADDGEIASISGLNLVRLEQECPLLALAMEPSKTGPRLHLEALTSATADAFARYLSTSSYALNSSDFDIFESVPTSLLFHCQLYHLGALFDLAGLKMQANVNIIRQCEFGCSSPDPPIELCAAISFAYEHLREHAAIIDTIINYCVSCFIQHRLGTDREFRKLAYDLRPLHQDLCRISIKREFENDTAIAIIQMPFKPYIPDTYASREDIDGKAYTDYVHHFHGDDDDDDDDDDHDRLTKKRKRLESGMSGLARADASNTSTSSHLLDALRLNRADRSRKRRASSVAEPMIKPEPDSEPEYEVIAGPAPVEELSSDSDSDASTLVHIALPATASQIQSNLPIRPRTAAHSSTTSAADDADAQSSGSESDWTLV